MLLMYVYAVLYEVYHHVFYKILIIVYNCENVYAIH